MTGEMEMVVVRCSAREATAEARRCSVAAVVLRLAKEEPGNLEMRARGGSGRTLGC